MLTGCLSISNVKPNSSLELNSDEGIIIIGAPDDIRIAFHSGNVIDNKFFDDEFLPKGFVGNPEAGYLIRKLKATIKDRGYGLTSLHTTNGNYTAKCGEQEEMVLEVKGGEIQYYTDISFKEDQSSIAVSYDNNVEKAKWYVQKYFPKNTSPITVGNFRKIVKGTCYPSEMEILSNLPRIKIE